MNIVTPTSFKIRIYSPFYPYPPTEGAFQVVYEQLLSLHALGHSVELVYWKGSSGQNPDGTFRGLPEGIKVTRLKKWTLPLLGRLLLSAFTPVTSPELYHYPGLAPRFSDSVDLEIFHYSFSYFWINRLSRSSSSQSFGEANQPKRVVVFHNLESDLYRQRARQSKFLKKAIDRFTSIRLKMHELSLENTAFQLWFLSPKDQTDYLKRLIQKFPDRPVDHRLRLVPPVFSPALAQSRKRKWMGSERSHSDKAILGFLGGMGFQPNFKSVQWIITELAPILESLSFDGEIWIAGKGASSALIASAQSYPFIKFLGFVENIENFWDSISYMLVPHTEGSGVRIKLLEAVASGIPVLTHLASLERIDESLRHHPLVLASDSPEEWARQIVAFHPSQIRNEYSETDLPLPDGLNGESVFSFLKSLLS